MNTVKRSMNGTVDRPAARRRGPHLLDIVPGQHRPKLVRNGAIFAALAAIFLYVIYTKPPLPFSSSGTAIKADFKYAADVVPGRTPVRVDGVDVGLVTGQAPLPGSRGVELTLTLNQHPGFTVKEDATAALRWRTLLGLNYYVDLAPGSTSAPALGGAPIPESHTNSQVELDQVLEPLNAQGRHAVQTMIDQFDTGFSDPAAVRTTIHAAAPAMNSLAQGLPGLRGINPGVDLPTLVGSTNAWMGVLARDETNLGSLVDNGATALGVTAAQRIDLGSTFDEAPAALVQTQATMARLRTTISILTPLAQRLEPGAKRLYRAAKLARVAVDEANPLLVELKPTLAALRPSVNSLAVTARAGVPVVSSLSSTLNRTRTSFIPFLNAVDPETKLKNYQAVGPALASVSSVTGYGDRFGALAGFEAGFGENTVGGISPCSTFVTNPTVTQKLDCEGLTQLIEKLFTGRPASAPLLRSPVPETLVNNLLGLKTK
jgi:ABC-type transporter Mla subunit MlaD